MIRLILLPLLLCAALSAQWEEVSSATYKVGYGFIDELGTATAALYRDGERYKILVHARATGFAAFLSGDREEFYESRGVVEGNILVPHAYRQEKLAHGDRDQTIFRFDHAEKNVSVHRLRCKGKKCRKTQKFHDFYAPDDLLSLYFNLNAYTKGARPGQFYQFAAVGPKKGKLDLLFPDGKKKEEVEESLGDEEGRAIIAIVHQKIFSSEKGELFMRLDGDGVCTKALLKNVVLFGDIHGTLEKKTARENWLP